MTAARILLAWHQTNRAGHRKDDFMTTMSNENEESAVLADGIEALQQALAAEHLGYATDRCAEEYLRVLDGARIVADASGLRGADRRGYLAHMDALARAQVVADAARRRDH
jgi:hypothetical protein